MKKWEYKRSNRRLSDRELTILGVEGWELVSHTVIKYENFWTSDNSEYYVFKREKPKND
jgi:hypothetical protein